MKSYVLKSEKINKLLEETNQNVATDLRHGVRCECQYPDFLEALSGSKMLSDQLNANLDCRPCPVAILNKLRNTPVVISSTWDFIDCMKNREDDDNPKYLNIFARVNDNSSRDLNANWIKLEMARKK